MKVVLLTTETTHHTYFAWQVSQHFPLRAIMLETRSVIPPFDTFHPFEERRDAYERDFLLGATSPIISDIAETHSFESMNEAECVSTLQALAPDAVIVFGTGKLYSPIIEVATVACLNLHGGNPEEYRGLDTHLWAIYHRDFNNLVTTLHYVDSELDTGDIVFQAQLKLNKDNQLHELRSINTKVCVDLTLLALNSLQATERLPARRQLSRGRYYSFMPSVLKAECVKKFQQYIAKL